MVAEAWTAPGIGGMRYYGITSFALWIGLSALAAAQPEDLSSAGLLDIVCSLEQPVVGPHEPVKATVLVNAVEPQSLQYRWKANAGGFVTQSSQISDEASGPTVEWNPNGIASGSYTLTVTVTNAEGSLGSCSVVVVVGKEERSASEVPSTREIRRALLLKGRAESKGYALYSYMLLGAPVNDSNRERYQKFVQAYLDRIREFKELESLFLSSQLNITYLPVDSEPSEPCDTDWVLEHFDYERARFLLASVPGTHGDGPFIISSYHPLQGPNTITKPYIFEDLSSVPPDVVALWVQQFKSQTAQERSWDKETVSRVVLKLRTVIAIAAIALPDVQKAVFQWIKLGSNP
jgi:hypothetical protein